MSELDFMDEPMSDDERLVMQETMHKQQIEALAAENERLQDAYKTLEFISKYDGKDNNRRSMHEEFIYIKVKAMDCIDRIKKYQSGLLLIKTDG